MVKFDTTRYVFGTSAAPKTLLDLFAGQRQLIVLRFVDNGPDDYCPGCTNFTSNTVGLARMAGTGVSWATCPTAAGPDRGLQGADGLDHAVRVVARNDIRRRLRQRRRGPVFWPKT